MFFNYILFGFCINIYPSNALQFDNYINNMLFKCV